jgi:hypothetical protein
MTDTSNIREPAEIPAVELIGRSAVMPMSAAGLSADEPVRGPGEKYTGPVWWPAHHLPKLGEYPRGL